MKSSIRLSLSALLVVAVVGCKNNKKPDSGTEGADATSANGGGAPAIDSTAMNFDAAGSDSGKIEGLKTIQFEYDKAALTNEGRKRAQSAADWLKNNSSNSIQIEGHCDARGSIEYNLSLGERRAKTVMEYMVSLGVDSKRISTISYGKEKPIARGDSEADSAKNRRANFVPLAR